MPGCCLRALPAALVTLGLALPAAALTVTDLGSAVELATPELTVTVQKVPFAMSVADASGPFLDQAPSPSLASLGYLRGPTAYHVGAVTAWAQAGDRVTFGCATDEGPPATVAVERIDDGTLLVELAPPSPATVTEAVDVFVAAAGERYYGLSERIADGGFLDGPSEVSPQAIGSLDRRGENVRAAVTPTMSIYTPFFHSSRRYGLFVDGPMQGTFDLAKATSDRVVVRFAFDATAGTFRYYVLHGPGHAAILERYTALTGRPWLPPRWVFKHMRWRDEDAAGATALLDGVAVNADLAEDVAMYETLGFPSPGWYVFDRPWTSGAQGSCISGGFARFEFDPVRFPNAAAMIASLATRGTRTAVFNAPWACGSPSDPLDNAYEATLYGYLAPNSADHIDWTNPAATSWWQAKVGAFAAANGVSGFKLDRGDEFVPSTAADVYFDGRTGLALHNDYPRLYVKAYHDALEALMPGDWVTMTRPGYAGSQAYGIYWGGDSTGADLFGLGAGTDKGLRSALIGLQRTAFMGFPTWGTDTGGYYQFKQRDVFARWLQFSALNPIMEIGGGKQAGMATGAPHAPWAMPTSPVYDTEMIAIYRYYTWLHHELVPYTYSEAVRAHATGHPIATPLPFDYPDDPAAADLIDEYLYGPWLLVAPLWQDGARSRDVYLPSGQWIDYWDDEALLLGPATLAGVSVPLDRLPLYVKAGAILPLAVESGETGHGSAASSGRLTLDVHPHQSSSYTLREEGGTIVLGATMAGDYGERRPITVTSGPATRDWLLRVKTFYKPIRVTRDAVALVERADQASLDAAASGWLYLGAEGRTLVKHSTTAAAATVVLEPPCTVTTGGQTAWVKARLRASHVNDGTPGNDALTLRGRFTLASGTFGVDPIAAGARIDVTDARGVARVSVTLPPGGYGAAGPGWTRNAAASRWVWRDPTPGAPLRRATVTSKGGGLVAITASGRKADYALLPGDVPLGMTVTLGGAPAALAGDCGETTFPAPSCRVGAAGTRIACR